MSFAITWPRSRGVECAASFSAISIANYVVSLVVCMMNEEL